MMKLPIDTSSIRFTCTRQGERRTVRETGQPRLDRETGRELWQVQVMALTAEGAEILAITVPVNRPSPWASPSSSRAWWGCRGHKATAPVSPIAPARSGPRVRQNKPATPVSPGGRRNRPKPPVPASEGGKAFLLNTIRNCPGAGDGIGRGRDANHNDRKQ